ncbi:Stk1 family PASTA domain-containing Ser/Thr kinase [Microbacterium sp.]|uniref:Stk1 family PASTA domain-containing Ser/Thr kinase n=1 Tax=Microbacterium sp. TaxID=51671 RepID=UPI002CADE4F9|nr:Stk1 family PASTA domain-containing Ser/Thr kinase [Microbacterium sp.]HWL76216.1 Stk1 family PASTA domain-containing Ser/Thr kinase [Microbacterium sp.]
MSTSQQVDPLIGRLVDGRYRVRARIARGGMATVYVATDLRLERRVALKVMHSHLSDDTVFQSRFIQEARAAARLADPHVVNVFDQGQDGEMAYLVMEYLPGITLRELLREQRRLTVPQTISVMDAVLSGLAAAHRAGIVHRDVKPENVLLAEDGRIKIGDFGLARATTANTATGSQLLGTIAYLAPELVTRGTADARSDIYALGIMLYEMLTGEQPYKGEQPMQIAYQHATDSVPRPSVKNPGVPEQLDELVLWATEKTPDDRPTDAQVMLDRLREIERELGITPQTTTRSAATGVIADDVIDSGELTAVLPSTTGHTTSPVETVDNATRLRRATKRRAAKGGWLIALVLLLAGLAGATGWWFGSGPGSLVAVPDVTGRTFAEAEQLLAAESLVAIEEGENSLDVDPGLVIRSEPPVGARVEKESEVRVIVSLGPAEVTVERLIDLTETDARRILEDLGITPDEENEEFFTGAPQGAVVGTMLNPRVGEPYACGEGCTAHEGDGATLWVSLGPVPDVVGESEDSARRTLEGVRLLVAEESQTETSEEIAAGDVIRVLGREDGGWLRPGDTVTLVVSTGPPLFPIPDVQDLTRDEAIATLEGAGFQVDYAVFWAAFPNSLTRVTGTDPAPGEMRVKGTRVYLQITASG